MENRQRRRGAEGIESGARREGKERDRMSRDVEPRGRVYSLSYLKCDRWEDTRYGIEFRDGVLQL